MKRIPIALTVLLFLLAQAAAAGDYPRNQSLYVSMRDGVRIAIDVWLPADLDESDSIPTLMHATRYWRARQNVSARIEDDNRFEEAEQVNQAGYALVLVDAVSSLGGSVSNTNSALPSASS